MIYLVVRCHHCDDSHSHGSGILDSHRTCMSTDVSFYRWRSSIRSYRDRQYRQSIPTLPIGPWRVSRPCTSSLRHSRSVLMYTDPCPSEVWRRSERSSIRIQQSIHLRSHQTELVSSRILRDPWDNTRSEDTSDVSMEYRWYHRSWHNLSHSNLTRSLLRSLHVPVSEGGMVETLPILEEKPRRSEGEKIVTCLTTANEM